MQRFWDTVVEPLFEILQPEVIVEIGSAKGGNTENLLEYCRRHGATLHVIDPAPQYEVSAWQQKPGQRLVFHQDLSLNALPRIEGYDAVLIDGDHNWYTVFNELKLIEEACQERGAGLPVVVLHDVGWPYARRDAYHDPDTVPEEHRQPYERKGVVRGQSALAEEGANPNNANAVREGGPKNGVLTAVEDFLACTSRDVRFILLEGLHGLGVLAERQLAVENPGFWRILDTIEPSDVLARHLRKVEEERLACRTARRELARRLARGGSRGS